MVTLRGAGEYFSNGQVYFEHLRAPASTTLK
jgi:hypothetical protein